MKGDLFMYAYMTNGTVDHLRKIKDKHKNLNLLLMSSQDKTVAYYEDQQPSIFETAREYDIIVKTGELKQEGYVVMNNIPVTDEGRPIFETSFKNRAGTIEGVSGFNGMRVLRPYDGNVYVVMVQWQDQESYQHWKNSEEFAKSHKKDAKSKDKPPYTAGPSYVNEFHMDEREEE